MSVRADKDESRLFPAGFSLVFIGIGILRFWYQYNLYNLHFSTDYGVGVAWANILRAIVGFLLVLMALRKEISPRWRNVLVWGSLVLMTLSSIFNFLELVTGITSLEVARYVTLGLGLVWGGGMWMDFFARLRPSRAFIYLLGGLITSCLLSLICGYLSPIAMGLLNLFVPALSVLAFWHAMHLLDARGIAVSPLPQSDQAYSGQQLGEIVRIGITFCLFAFVMGIALGFPDGHPRELSSEMRSVHQILLIIILMSVGWLVFVKGWTFKFTGVGLLENSLLIASIILLVDERFTANEVGTALILSAESFFYSFVFLTSYSVGLRTRHPAIFMLGVYYSSALLAMGAGRLLSTTISSVPGTTVATILAMSIILVIEMVIALRLTITHGDTPLFSEIGPAGLVENNGGNLSEHTSSAEIAPHAYSTIETDRNVLNAMVNDWGLTTIEASIAALITRGRSRSFIAQELGYSENTIRNYTRVLYQKLNVHSKQELIDLIEYKFHSF